MWYGLHSPFFLLHVVAFALSLAFGIYLLINSNFVSAAIATMATVNDDENTYEAAPGEFPEEKVKALRRIRDYMRVIGIGAVVVACLSFANLYTFLALILEANSHPVKYMPGMKKSRKRLVKEVVRLDKKDGRK